MALTKVSTGMLSADVASIDLNIDANTMYIDVSNNRVGINNAAPSTALDVTGSVTADGLAVDGDGLLYSASNVEMRGDANVRISLGTAGTSGANNSSNWIYGNGTNLRFNNAGGYHSWETLGTERMRIDASGNVGIGTNLPAQLLNLESATNPAILITDTTNTTSLLLRSQNNTSSVGTSSNHPLVFETNSAEAMRIDVSGNLLLGKSVVNSQAIIGCEIQTDGEVYSTIATGFNSYHVYANGGYRFYVNANGGIHNYSANNVNLSDEREKKNIELLESQWDSLKQWNLKKFHYNADDDSDNKTLGVIAQEVEAHNPEVIDEFNVDDDTTRLAVKEQQMMWMAIKALQEAQTRIESLEARIAALES